MGANISTEESALNFLNDPRTTKVAKLHFPNFPDSFHDSNSSNAPSATNFSATPIFTNPHIENQSNLISEQNFLCNSSFQNSSFSSSRNVFETSAKFPVKQLSYSEYGDPDGHPVFFFPGIGGSRFMVSLMIGSYSEELRKKQKLRLICVDYPGYGESTPQPNRTLKDWCDTFYAFLETLKLNEAKDNKKNESEKMSFDGMKLNEFDGIDFKTSAVKNINYAADGEEPGKTFAETEVSKDGNENGIQTKISESKSETTSVGCFSIIATSAGAVHACAIACDERFKTRVKAVAMLGPWVSTSTEGMPSTKQLACYVPGFMLNLFVSTMTTLAKVFVNPNPDKNSFLSRFSILHFTDEKGKNLTDRKIDEFVEDALSDEETKVVNKWRKQGGGWRIVIKKILETGLVGRNNGFKDTFLICTEAYNKFGFDMERDFGSDIKVKIVCGDCDGMVPCEAIRRFYKDLIYPKNDGINNESEANNCSNRREPAAFKVVPNGTHDGMPVMFMGEALEFLIKHAE